MCFPENPTIMPYFPIPDLPWIIPTFSGHEELRIKKYYAIRVPKPHKPSLLATFSPLTQIRIRNKHTTNTEEDQGAGFPALVQHGYTTWTSKLSGTEWRDWSSATYGPSAAKRSWYKRSRCIQSTHSLCARVTVHQMPASRGRKSPSTGKIPVQRQRHSLPQ